MYGEKRELITFQCTICRTPCPLWVDREDWERAKLGMPVHLAFASRTGQVYLSSPELQLFTSGSCDHCRDAARGLTEGLACRRCGKVLASPGVCSSCLDVLQLCAEIREFVSQVLARMQPDDNAKRLGSKFAEALRLDFVRTILVFGVADGPLASSELAVLADLWASFFPEEATSATSMQCALLLAESFFKVNPKPVPMPPESLSALETYDEAAGTQYGSVLRSLLIQMAKLIVKVDGVVSGPEIEFVSYYENMLRRGWTRTSRAEAAADQQKLSQAPSLGNPHPEEKVDRPAVAPHVSAASARLQPSAR